MDNMIVIDNMTFRYDNNIVFKDFSLSIKKGSFTTVLGNNGCGKTTLVRLLAGLEKSNSIFIDGEILNDENILSVRKKIGVVFDNPDISFFSETVMDELAFSLYSIDYSNDSIYSYINEFSSYLGIDYLLNRNPRDLSAGEKQLVVLACVLITRPKLLILDDGFSMIDGHIKKNILLLLKRINHDFNTTILNITHDIDDSVYGDDILIISNGILVHDKKDNVYKQEKLLRKYGFDLPFMVSLSNKLSYYDMVDDVLYDMNEMVDLLWK